MHAVAAEARIEVAGTFGAVGAILDKFRAGDACDVVILTRAQIAELNSQARLHPQTASDLGAVATSIAVRANEPAPDVSDAERLRALDHADEELRRAVDRLGAGLCAHDVEQPFHGI